MATLSCLESCLLPPPVTVRWNQGNLTVEEYTTCQKVAYCAKNFFAFFALLAVSPLTLAYDYLAEKQVAPIQKAPNIGPQSIWPPVQRGFASSLFQTSGLGTKWSATPGLRGRCDWDKWMDKPEHIAHEEGFDYKNFFTDILSDPAAYIEMLKAQNVTAHRFSLEWSVIEPEARVIDSHAVDLYRKFIQKLLEAGITPSVTLNHFVLPEWFYESGSFQKMENIDRYVDFALFAMEQFPEVKDWWSFNELGVKAFQQSREVYPTDLPEGSSLPARVYAAGIATRNMLIAHCKLHQRVAEFYPDRKLGVTHQWLKFDMATGNWLERLFAYYFTKFGFTPVYQFFKEGRFSFEFPFMANIQFEIPKKEFDESGQFLMRLGLQAYPKAQFKMGLNNGESYPGTVVNLGPFTFGSTCEPGGAVMKFGPRWNASGMDECLDEAFALTDQVFITEYGSDASVQKWDEPGFAFNDEAQANYLKQLTERIQSYCAKNFKTIEGIFCWSDLRRQLEWENGHKCRLAVIEPVVDDNRLMTGWMATSASKYLAGLYKTAGFANRWIA